MSHFGVVRTKGIKTCSTETGELGGCSFNYEYTIDEDQIGMDVYGSEVTIALSSLFGNTEYALYNADDQFVNAVGNWWGDVTGPYSEVGNPAGLGDHIYGQVDFSGWLSEAI